MLIVFFIIFRPVHGLIFLFKYVQDDEPAGSVVRDSRLEKIFFAKQVRPITQIIQLIPFSFFNHSIHFIQQKLFIFFMIR